LPNHAGDHARRDMDDVDPGDKPAARRCSLKDAI